MKGSAGRGNGNYVGSLNWFGEQMCRSKQRRQRKVDKKSRRRRGGGGGERAINREKQTRRENVGEKARDGRR